MERVQAHVQRKTATSGRNAGVRAANHRQNASVLSVISSAPRAATNALAAPQTLHQPSLMRQCDTCSEELQAKAYGDQTINTQTQHLSKQPSISHPDDPLEVQADRVADAVMARSTPLFSAPEFATPATGLANGSTASATSAVTNSASNSLQRKCSACQEEVPDLQAKATTTPANNSGHSHRAVLQRNIAELHERNPQQLLTRANQGAQQLQRLCTKCEAEKLQRKTQAPAGTQELSQISAPEIPSTSADLWPRINNVFRTGRPLPSNLVDFYQARMGYDFSAVRIHIHSQASEVARSINARAFTYRNHLVFAAGEYQPDSRSGRHLLAHELTHVVQQGAATLAENNATPAVHNEQEVAPVSAPPATISPNLRKSTSHEPSLQRNILDDAWDTLGDAYDSASDAADEAYDTVSDAASDVYNAAADTAHAVYHEASDLANDAYDAVSDLAEDAYDTVTELLDEARAFAHAIGGMLSLHGTTLVIDVPDMNVCPTVDLQVQLPSLDLYLPLISGSFDIDNLTIDGTAGIAYSFAPVVSVQLGPCLLHGLHIEKDLLGFDWSLSGALSVSTALGLATEAILSAAANANLTARLPVAPPNELFIPDITLGLGIAAQAHAIVASTMDIAVAARGGLGGLNAALAIDQDVGVALDFGLAGAGLINIQGVDLCRFYQPFFEEHLAASLHVGIAGSISISPFSASASLGIGAFAMNSFGDLPLAFSRDLFTDDCARLQAWCQTLYNMGWMPSQNGGAWTGHPSPAWDAPSPVYPRDPSQLNSSFTSGALCRGACGPDCMTCSTPIDKVECVPNDSSGQAGHEIWVYPEYQECPTYEGCREHDACYDYCSSGASPLGDGLCSRLCDMECMCNYPPFNCLSWVMGGPPNDDFPMIFSDEPYIASECALPCPTSTAAPPVGAGPAPATSSGTSTTAWGGGDISQYSICLPTLELFGRQPWQSDVWDESTPNYTIWSQWIELPPPVFLANLELVMNGHARANASAGLGPATINNVCFGVDFSNGDYLATGTLDIAADFTAQLNVGGELCANGSWLGLLNVISGCAGVEATGNLSLRANMRATMLHQLADMDCDGGTPRLSSDLAFNLAALLDFAMDATFRLTSIGGIQLYSNHWNLIQAQWDKEWGDDLDVNANPIGDPTLDLRSHRFTLSEIGELLEWLFSDSSEETETDTNNQKTVIENPLTAAKARTIPALASQLDRPQHTGSSLSLVGGASSGVGISMISRYITDATLMGSETSSNVQPELYGYGKLPARGDLGSGTGQGKDIQYIKGHLLNFHHSRGLGGFAINANLYPITAAANGDHNQSVEELVKDLVHKDHLVVMYEVAVINTNGPHQFNARDDDPTKTCTYQYINATFRCSYATYKLYNDNSVALNTVTTVPVREDFNVNAFKARMIAKDCPNGP